jgi:hypothetical protein
MAMSALESTEIAVLSARLLALLCTLIKAQVTVSVEMMMSVQTSKCVSKAKMLARF